MGNRILNLDSIHGVPIDSINDHLFKVWLKAAMLANSPEGETVDWKITSLSQYLSTWSSHDEADVHFRIKMGPPRIKPVCSQEVILYFNIDSIEFFNSTDFSV